MYHIYSPPEAGNIYALWDEGDGMDTTRAVNGKPVKREQLKDYTISDPRVLGIVERARKRDGRSGYAK